jgi:hypothetical protein
MRNNRPDVRARAAELLLTFIDSLGNAADAAVYSLFEAHFNFRPCCEKNSELMLLNGELLTTS